MCTKQPHHRAWNNVLLLSFAAFIFNTTEFAPVALLSNIAQDFSMQSAQAGIMLTIYAWMVALCSLPLMLLTGHIERRNLLIVIVALFIISHLLSTIAWNFWVLVIARIGIALAHAIFWSITAALTVRLAPKGKGTQALSLLAAGTALATVLGLPLGRFIGQLFSWRTTFLIIAILASWMLFAFYKYLPTLPSKDSGSWKSMTIITHRPALLGIYLLTAITMSGHYTAYSYIEPFILKIAHMTPNFATLMLFILGGAGILGSILYNRISKSYDLSILPIATCLLSLCLFFLLFASAHPFTLILLCILWGIAFMCIMLNLQVRVLRLAPDATDVAMSLYSGIFNIGIGTGALVGKQISLHVNMGDIGFVASAITFIALLWIIYLLYRYRNSLQQHADHL